MTNVSKKSFNICPIETYTRYGMELLFYLMDDIFQVLQSIINTFVVYNVAFDSLWLWWKKLRKVNNCTFISLLKGEIFRYFIKSSKKFPLETGVWEASWEGMSLIEGLSRCPCPNPLSIGRLSRVFKGVCWLGAQKRSKNFQIFSPLILHDHPSHPKSLNIHHTGHQYRCSTVKT